MTSYQSRNLIRTTLKKMIPEQVAECRACDDLPEPLKELIIHNFQAEYVCYNKEDESVEIGVQNQEDSDSYPTFKIFNLKLEEISGWIGRTFKKEELDLKFYARLIAEGGSGKNVDEVVLV